MHTACRRVSVDIRESTRPFENGKGRGRVDTSKGVVYGVRVLGTRSSNGRRYLPEAIRAAAHLYEGVSVRIDHPERPDDQRSTESVLGWLRDVRVAPDGGLVADLHYLKTHPFAPRLVESVLRNPRCWALSHNAQGETETVNGTLVVHEITEVRSVDLVADPATTTSLFESRAATKPKGDSKTMKLLERFERIPLLPRDRRAVQALFEAGGAMAGLGDMPADDVPMDTGLDPATADPAMADPADESPEAALSGGFNRACHLILDDTTIPTKDKIRRLKEILTAADRMVASGQEVPEAEGEPHPEPDGDEMLESEPDGDEPLAECDDDGLKAMRESRDPKLVRRAERIELARLRREKAVRALCEAEGHAPDAAEFEALCALPTEAKRLALIESRKALGARPAARPRAGNGGHGGGTPLAEGRRGQPGTPAADPAQLPDGDTEAFVRFLTRNAN